MLYLFSITFLSYLHGLFQAVVLCDSIAAGIPIYTACPILFGLVYMISCNICKIYKVANLSIDFPILKEFPICYIRTKFVIFVVDFLHLGHLLMSSWRVIIYLVMFFPNPLMCLVWHKIIKQSFFDHLRYSNIKIPRYVRTLVFHKQRFIKHA